MKNETLARTDKKITIDSSSKKFIPIVVISVLALLVLGVLLLRSGQFVGKAFFTISADPLVEISEGNVIIKIAAGDTGMTGASFDVQITGANICSMMPSDLLGGMGAPDSYTCANEVLHFDDALPWAGAAQAVKTGDVEILQIAATSGEFIFSNYEVLNGEDIFLAPSDLRVALEGSITATSETCGDTIIDADEECDGENLYDNSCTSQGFDSGILSCDGTCQFDTSSCLTTAPLECTEDMCRDDFNLIDITQCPAGDTCQSVDDLFAGLTPAGRVALCSSYGIAATTCPGTSTFNADINGDTLIDDRDALFIFQAIEAKQSAYNYCGAAGQPPCVFGDRAICEDVSYRWTSNTTVTSASALPTPQTSSTLEAAGILCGNLEASS